MIGLGSDKNIVKKGVEVYTYVKIIKIINKNYFKKIFFKGGGGVHLRQLPAGDPQQ